MARQKRKAKPEQVLQTDVSRMLKTHPDVCFYEHTARKGLTVTEHDKINAQKILKAKDFRIFLWRQNVLAARAPSGNFVRAGFKGQPDYMGLDATGRLIGIELKSPKGRQNYSQKAFEAVMDQFFGVYAVARSIQEVRDVISQCVEDVKSLYGNQNLSE